LKSHSERGKRRLEFRVYAVFATFRLKAGLQTEAATRAACWRFIGVRCPPKSGATAARKHEDDLAKGRAERAKEGGSLGSSSLPEAIIYA